MGQIYPIDPNLDGRALVEALTSFLKNRNMTVQNLSIGESQWLVQAVKTSALKMAFGLNKAATIRLALNERTLEVEIGQGKWLDKAAGAAIGWYLFWPAMVTAAVGAYRQSRFPGEIYRFIQEYITQAASDAPGVNGTAQTGPAGLDPVADADASPATAADSAMNVGASAEQDPAPSPVPPEAVSASEASAAAGEIVPQGKAIFCSNCGARLRDGVRFCEDCGSRVE